MARAGTGTFPFKCVNQAYNTIHAKLLSIAEDAGITVHRPVILDFDVQTSLNETRAAIHQLPNLDVLTIGSLNTLGTILSEREMQMGILTNRSTDPDAPLQHLPEVSEQRTKYLDKLEARMAALMKYVGELKKGIENQMNNWTMANRSLSLPYVPDGLLDEPVFASLDDYAHPLIGKEVEGGRFNRNSPPPLQPKNKKRRNALRRCFAGVRRSATSCFKAQ